MSILTISVKVLYEIINKDPSTVVIDVRTVEEYQEGCILGSHSFPLANLISDENMMRQISALQQSPQQAIYVTCASGQRALIAGTKMLEEDILNVVLLEGGTEAWINEGLPVEKTR